MRNIILTLFLTMLSALSYAQTTVIPGGPRNISKQGGYKADSMFWVPVREPGEWFNWTGDSLKGTITFNPIDSQFYGHDGNTWGIIGSGGAVDSAMFVTITRLIDSLSRVQQTLDDSTAALRLLIASGSADSALFATLYRLDTTRAGLDMRIALKQNQLNGTGFVKISGTTISYDNSTYTPTGRTITINGNTQDLSANRTWTIAVPDVSGLMPYSDTNAIIATKYGVDTAKANLRMSINNKQNLITLSTTGTSGAATFNQSTGALNIPNYANTTYTGSTSIPLSGNSFQRAALTGDVTATQNSNSTTISNSAVTNAKMANMATQTFKGRNTAGSGAPEDISISTARTMLSINNVDNTSDLNKPISTATQNALDLKIDSLKTSIDSIFVKYDGTWYYAGKIVATGAGVSWGDLSGTLSNQTDLQNALNGKLNIGDSTIYFSVSRALDSLSDHWTAINGKLNSNDSRIANWTAAYNDKINSAAFSGTTTKTLTLTQQDGGTVTASFTDDNTTYTGSTSISLTGGSFQRAALTGDVTSPANSNSTTIANNAVTNAKAADMAVNTIKGRITAGTGDPQDLTASQVRTIINVADGAEVNVNADWNAVSGDAMILNKPTIPDISGLAPQQALDDSMDIVRDSINALRADIGSGGGGGLDTTAGDARYWKQGGNSASGALVGGTTTNQDVVIRRNGIDKIRVTADSITFPGIRNIEISPTTGLLRFFTPTSGGYFVGSSINRIDNGNQLMGAFWYNTGPNNVTRYTIGTAYDANGLSVFPSNNVSIGKLTNSGSKLEVQGNSASVGSALLVENSSGADILKANNDRTIQIEGYSGADTALVGIDASGNLLRKGINTLPFLSLSDTAGLWLSSGTVVTNWSGSSTGLNAATGRTSLGGTTVGQSIFTLTNPSAIAFIRVNANNTVTARSVADTRTDLGGTTVGQSFFTLTNPSAITFPRINANNTVSALSASDFRTDIGAGTGSGTVTSVGISVPTGFSVSSSPVTSSGTIAITYAAGYQGYTSSEASKLSGIEAGADVTDATNVAAAGAVMDGDFSANGVMIRTGSGAYTSRTITGTANQISVSNGDGVSGNPTLSLHSDVITALGKANTSLQPSDTVSVLFTKSDALIIRKYVDNCTSCTLTVNDHRTILRIANASPITLYVPTGLQDDFEVLIEQAGAGKITVSALSGVAIGSFESAFTTKGTYATATLYATEEEDEFTLTGNLE